MKILSDNKTARKNMETRHIWVDAVKNNFFVFGWYRITDVHKELVRNLEAKVRSLPPGLQLTTPQRMILQEYLDQVIEEEVRKTEAETEKQAEAAFAEIRDYPPFPL